MDTLRRVEEKVDGLNLRAHARTSVSGAPKAVQQGSESLVSPRSHQASLSERNSNVLGHSESETLNAQHQQIHTPHWLPKHSMMPNLVLLWPRIYSDLVSSQGSIELDLRSILHEGVSWFAKKEASKHKTSLSTGDEQRAVGPDASHRARASDFGCAILSDPAQVREISAAYFDTFNLMYPILHRGHFMKAILDASLQKGRIGGGADGTILLLVLALGRVSIEGNSGTPISIPDLQPSGFRGGSLEEPPGLVEFNEARRHFGFLAVDCTIDYVQIMLLQSVYYESHARHIDYWRCVTLASSAVQGLQKLQSVDWDSFLGDQVKRAFWTCVIQEDFFHIALDLPETGIMRGEATVPLPHFHGSQDHPEKLNSDKAWVYKAQFLALIALRSIIMRIHDVMYSSKGLSYFIMRIFLFIR
jgi:hypothetical protein